MKQPIFWSSKFAFWAPKISCFIRNLDSIETTTAYAKNPNFTIFLMQFWAVFEPKIDFSVWKKVQAQFQLKSFVGSCLVATLPLSQVYQMS